MSAQQYHWVLSHFSALYGAVPEPGCTWMFRDSELDRSHLYQLSDRGLITREDYNSKEGTMWTTSRSFADEMKRAAESRDVDRDELFLTLKTPAKA